MTIENSAYNSTCITKQILSDRKQGFIEKQLKRGELFKFTKSTDALSMFFLKSDSPKKIRKAKADKDLSSIESYWNNERLEPVKMPGFFGGYYTLAFLCEIGLMFGYPIFWLSAFTVKLATEVSNTEFFNTAINVHIYFFFPMLVIASPFILLRFVPVSTKFVVNQLRKVLRKKYTLERKTGMVTVYGDDNDVIFSHPFIEFDCMFSSLATHQGILKYRLNLVHRYSDDFATVEIGSLIGQEAPIKEYHLLWNMIQRYMDVSQPMPDVPMLEEFRHLDAVTAEYDQKVGRKPRYWRDMSDEEFEKVLDQISEKQEKEPATGPIINIFEDA